MINKEVKIITTIKELKSFCKNNNIKCVKDRKEKDRFILTIPPYFYTITNSTYKKDFKYEIDYFIDCFVITIYDCYYDDFNRVKKIYSFNNSQNQILGVVFLRNEFIVFTKSEKIKWEDTKWLHGYEFRGDNE